VTSSTFTPTITPLLHPLRESFRPLLLLALNACGITTWTTVLNLETLVPNLQELYLAVNKLEDISAFPPLCKLIHPRCSHLIPLLASSQYPNLRILDLSSCGLSTWSSVAIAVGSLTLLEELILDSNPLPELEPAAENQFVNLHRLSLSGTRFLF
jgi:Leucine-rich repeat (LRR) protein